MAVTELRFGLEGTTVRFPDDRSYCLVCGAPPAGTRQVWFENMGAAKPDAFHLGDKTHALGQGIQMIRDRITFKAPLCRGHRRRALLIGLKAMGLMLLAVGVLVLGILVLKQVKVPRSWAKVAEWAPFVPALVPAIFGGLLWKKKDRGGLPCDASVFDGDLVLYYEGDPPVPVTGGRRPSTTGPGPAARPGPPSCRRD